MSVIANNKLYRTTCDSVEDAKEQLTAWESKKVDLPKGKEIKERKKDNYSFLKKYYVRDGGRKIHKVRQGAHKGFSKK